MGVSDFIDFIQRNENQDLKSYSKLHEAMSIKEELEYQTEEPVKNDIKSINSILEDLEDDDGNGSNNAYLVLIPKREIKNKNIIYRWKPRDFKKYPYIECMYSWDKWDFGYGKPIHHEYTFDFPEIILGYSYILTGNEKSEFKQPERVWEINEEFKNALNVNPFEEMKGNKPPSYSELQLKDYWIVNFEPFGYECFVEEIHDPLVIPILYYLKILNDHNMNITNFPSLKKTDIFETIQTKLDYN